MTHERQDDEDRGQQRDDAKSASAKVLHGPILKRRCLPCPNGRTTAVVSTCVYTLLNDIRYSVRRLLASPGFAFAAVATMALGIGANSAIFSVINAVMLRPMPVERSDRLVDIYTSGSDGVPATSSYPDYHDLRDQPVFDGGIAAYEATLQNVLNQGRSTVVFGEAVSG